MKKILILALVLSALLCMNVFAAEIDTITDPLTGDPIDAGKATILEKEVNGEPQKVAVEFTQSGVTEGNMYLVLILAANDGAETEEEKIPTRPTNGNILYVNQATADSSTITFDNLYPSEVKESYIFLAGVGENVGLDKPLAKINPLKPAGVDVSGQVTSYLAADGEVTIELFKEGAETAAYTTQTTTGKYSLTGVEAATYTMKVSKYGHVTRQYAITVGGVALVQDATINPLGDANGNGTVNLMDYRAILKYVQKDATAITDAYLLLCADANKNGSVNLMDYRAILKHIQKSPTLW